MRDMSTWLLLLAVVALASACGGARQGGLIQSPASMGLRSECGGAPGEDWRFMRSVFFERHSATLSRDQAKVLAQAAEQMQRLGITCLQIVSGVEYGEEEADRSALSLRRAGHVAARLRRLGLEDVEMHVRPVEDLEHRRRQWRPGSGEFGRQVYIDGW